MDAPTSQALGDLAAALAPHELRLTATDRANLLQRRDDLRAAVTGLARRLANPDAPLLVVVGGVTGGGKSTLVNTLAGARVAAAGVRRPTTSVPTLVCHPDHLDWFRGQDVLAELPRAEGPAGQSDAPAGVLHLVASAAVGPGVALLDAPDSDSVSAANRRLADVLLDAADAWLWVTTQSKYADRDSMALLRRARDRHAVVAALLAQVDAEHTDEVRSDYLARLAAERVEAEVLVVPRVRPQDDQLPDGAVAAVRGWVAGLTDGARPAEVRRQTVSGALAALPDEVRVIMRALDAEERTARELTGAAAEAYAQAGASFAEDLNAGRISLRDEVMASWLALVDSGPFRKLLSRASEGARRFLDEVRERRTRAATERTVATVHADARDAVIEAVSRLAASASRDLRERWMADPAGRQLLATGGSALEPGDDLAERTAEELAAWRAEIEELVTTAGEGRVRRSKIVAGAGNVATTAVVIGVFTMSGGLTGGELVAAGGGSALVQWVLEKIMGSANMEWLITQSRDSLLQRVSTLMDTERRRAVALVAEAAPDAQEMEALRAAVAAIDEHRAGTPGTPGTPETPSTQAHGRER